MAEEELELPEFPQDVPTSVGDEIAADGTQNICLAFCILLWNGIRWVPWMPAKVCGKSLEEILDLVEAIYVRPLAALGFQCRVQQGDCPAV